MSLRRLGILAAVLLAAGVYYYVVEVRQATERAAREAEAKQLLHFEVADAGALTIDSGDTSIKLVKRDGAWRMTAPVDDRADEATVSSVLNTLSALTPSRALEQPEDLGEYGLAEPQAVLQVAKADGAPLGELQIGDENPSATRRFVRAADGDTVGLIPNATYDSLVRKPFAFRSKQWTTISEADVKRVRLTTAKQEPVEVFRADDAQDRWMVATDPPKRAATQQVKNLIRRLLTARITGVVKETTEDWSAYGLAEPVRTAHLETDGATAAISFGNVVPDTDPAQRYARVEGSPRVLEFTSSAVEPWPQRPDEVRDRTLLHVTEQDIVRLRIVRDGQTVELQRTAPGADDWTLDGDSPAPADATHVSTLLRDLRLAKATRFLGVGEEPVRPADFDRAPVVVRLWTADAAEPHELRLAQGEATGTWYARRSGDPEVYPVEDALVKALHVTRDDLLDKHLVSFDREAVHRIEIRTAKADVAYEQRGDGTWRPAPGAPALDEFKLDQLLWDLTDLSYVRLISAADTALAGTPTLAIVLRDAAGTVLADVRIGARLADEDATRYAVAAGGVTAAIDGRIVSDWLPVFTGSPAAAPPA